MILTFRKYHGTGNDFIMIDNRHQIFDGTNQKLIAFLCDRHFGIGADGLILLENSVKYDFLMRYYNADGFEGSMCGNGGRCTVHFAKSLGIILEKTCFEAIDGLHAAVIQDDIISLQMGDVSLFEHFEQHSFVDTGSPHHVEMVKDLDTFNVLEIGRKKRYGAPYFEKGSNINFVEQKNENTFKIRTYERGVEDETLSCGTGVTATAIAMFDKGLTHSNKIYVEVLGGKLEVSFEKKEQVYKNVFLKGSATFVFEGQIKV